MSKEWKPRIFALLSKSGTAAGETALCERHFRSRANQDTARACAGSDVPRTAKFVDCTENEALRCPCGVSGWAS